jgi:probable HAF family extracellular repeat protein
MDRTGGAPSTGASPGSGGSAFGGATAFGGSSGAGGSPPVAGSSTGGAGAVAGAAGEAARFERLGRPEGATNFYASAVSGDGAVVVGVKQWPQRAVVWSRERVIKVIHNVAGTFSTSRDTNQDGTIVVGSFLWEDVTTVGVPFVWSEATGAEVAPVLPNDRYGTANGVSRDGSVVAGYSYELPLVTWGFRWTRTGERVDVPDFVANGISGDGAVLVGHVGAGEAFAWSQTGEKHLGMLPFDERSGASGANRDGSVIVGSSWQNGGIQHAFRWTEAAGMVELHPLPGDVWAIAWSTSADGSIAVGESRREDVWQMGPGTAVIWVGTQPARSLAEVLSEVGVDVSSFHPRVAIDVSDDGSVVVGTGTNASGHEEAFLARLR